MLMCLTSISMKMKNGDSIWNYMTDMTVSWWRIRYQQLWEKDTASIFCGGKAFTWEVIPHWSPHTKSTGRGGAKASAACLSLPCIELLQTYQKNSQSYPALPYLFSFQRPLSSEEGKLLKKVHNWQMMASLIRCPSKLLCRPFSQCPVLRLKLYTLSLSAWTPTCDQPLGLLSLFS